MLGPWITLVLAAWLIVSPFVIGYGHYAPAAMANDVILGALVAAFSVGRIAVRSGIAAWAVIILSSWLIVAPLVLGYYRRIPATNGAFNDFLTGGLILLTMIIHVVATRHHVGTEF